MIAGSGAFTAIMPELPEVEAARQLCQAALAGRTVVECHVKDDPIVFLSAEGPAAFRTHIVGRRVVAARRRGKWFWLELNTAPHALFHLGMTGQGHVQGRAALQYKSGGEARKPEEWPPRFTKAELVFDDGTRWAFADARRLGRIRLVNDPLHEPPVSLLGFDAYLDMPDIAPFTQQLLVRGAAVKAVLLDQSFSAGVGNWIADEVLYQARVHPATPASKLSTTEAAAIHAALKHIVRTAVACKERGEDLPAEWLFHYRWSKGASAPKDASGQAITFATVGGRTTAIVKRALTAAVAGKDGKTEGKGGRRRRKAVITAEVKTEVKTEVTTEVTASEVTTTVKRRRRTTASVESERVPAKRARRAEPVPEPSADVPPKRQRRASAALPPPPPPPSSRARRA